MTISQELITIGLCALGSAIMRFLPFTVFSTKKPTPKYVRYLGKVLPAATYSMIVVYCLRHVDFSYLPSLLPQVVAILFTIGVHVWKRETVLSIFAGTLLYMLLIRFM